MWTLICLRRIQDAENERRNISDLLLRMQQQEVVRRNGGVFFKCLNCGRRGPEGRNETEARRLWNEMILWNEAIRNEG